MSTAQFEVALWIELLAAGLGGLQGALFAATHRDRDIDVLGVIVVGLTVALGGSLLRDVVLNQPPLSSGGTGTSWLPAPAPSSASSSSQSLSGAGR